MLDLFIKVSSIVFKPLFDASKETIVGSLEPKRKMVKRLLELYENVEKIEYYSYELFEDIKKYERYVSPKEVTLRTEHIYKLKRKRKIDEDLNELKKAANKMGDSLTYVYNAMSFKKPELLRHLIGIHRLKMRFYGGIIVVPEVLSDINDPDDKMLILQPKEAITSIKYDQETLKFIFNKPDKIKNDYWSKISLDDNKEEIMKILNTSRSSLEQITVIKEKLKKFINEHITIEDFFR